jgi:hypothetical protein
MVVTSADLRKVNSLGLKIRRKARYGETPVTQAYIRYVWQNVTPTNTHFEQAFSSDGGKTWEVNWIYDGSRLPAQ